MSKIAPLFTWRSAVSSPAGPKSSTTRHVLLALSLYMNEKGESAFPSGNQLSIDTGLTERAIREHLKISKDEGWIRVSKHGFGGQKWARNDYRARIPEIFHKKIKAYESSQKLQRHYGLIPKTKKASKNQKKKAISAVSSKKSLEKLHEKPCLVCGEKKVQAHHHDYSKITDVYWLCKVHHDELHYMERRDIFAFDHRQNESSNQDIDTNKGSEPCSPPLQKGSERGSERLGTSFRKVVNHVHTNTSYNTSKNTSGDTHSQIVKILKNIPPPPDAKYLFKSDGFQEAFVAYWMMQKEEYSRWPAGAAVQATYMKLHNLNNEGQDVVKCLWQSVAKGHKEIYPVRDFDNKSERDKEEKRISQLPYYQQL